MAITSDEFVADRELGIELIPLFRGEWELGGSTLLRNTAVGTRLIMEMISGRLQGDRLSGKLIGRSSADWITIGPGRIGTIDFRNTIETTDGAVIYMHGTGRLDMNANESNTSYAYSGVLFEVQDERYSWLNRVQAVCKGVVDGNTVYDEFYEMK